MAVDTAEPPIARQISMNAVTQAILARGPTSRADLAKFTGLSKQTISDVVRHMETEGWLKPLGRTSGRRGRSAVTYALNAGAALAIAVDLGGTKTAVAVTDLVGSILAETVEPTDPVGGAAIAAQILRMIESLRVKGRPRVAVVGAPGVLHPETGRIEVAPNIPGLADIDLRALLADALTAPVVIENDVNLAARGEQWRGHAAGRRNFVFIALGTGIGMGIIADGHLLRGARGAAGEISYLPLGGDPYDPRGFALGTLETAVGSVGIARRYAGFGGRTEATVRDIFAGFAQGEPAAIATLEETARLIAPAIAAVAATLDPELVVMGGSIGAREELVETVRRFLARCTPYPPRVEASVLGGRASLVGAISVAVARLHNDLFGIDVPAVAPGGAHLNAATIVGEAPHAG